MLSPDEQSQLHNAITAIQRRASEALARTQDAWQAIAFVSVLHHNTDTVTAASDATGPTPECKPGCTHCCNARVEVSDAEALYIAKVVRQMPEQERLLLLDRLRVKAAASSGGMNAGIAPEPTPCAFLQEGLCSIYSFRPAVCRKAHSLSVEACETSARHIPQHFTRVVQCEALSAGVNEAYKSAGLPASRHELSGAVLAALAQDAAEEWYRGAPLPSDQPSQTRR